MKNHVHMALQVREEPLSRLMQYHDLDSLAGTWSKKEADDFRQAIDKFNQADENIWQ
ncbi:MAG: hypothetical protein RBR67_16675 [Desulfobacterium sp.]|jgi:hypothetical protein|nr:hypothetical protein [Desulfobacterium sp.]